jgi:CHAT domain-containing protein/Tfp pilus assembly protein PilF
LARGVIGRILMCSVRSRFLAKLRSRLLAPVIFFLVAGPVRGDDAAAGVVVEEVAKESPAARAGMLAGDLIVSWSRAPAPPANPQAAQGPIASPFDLSDVELDEAPRGPILLTGRRGRTEINWPLPPVPFGLRVRALLPEGLLRTYQEGRDLVGSKKLVEGAQRWRTAAQEAAGEGRRLFAVWLLSRSAGVLADARAWAEADAAYTEALRKVDVDVEPMVAAQLLRQWAETYRRRSDWSHAEESDQRALALDQKVGSGGLRAAKDLTALGRTAVERGDLPTAEAYWRRALAIREKLAPGSLDVASIVNNLGSLMQLRSDLTGAEDYLRRALAIRETLAPGSLEVAASLNNLALLVDDREDLAAAEQYLRRSLAIVEKLAPDSLEVAWRLNNLGNLARRRGDLAVADDYYRRALILKERINPGNLDVASTLDNLGIVAGDRGDLAAAEKYYRRALTIEEKLAPRSLDLASSLSNLGSLEAKRGDLAAAEESLRRALAIREALAPEGAGVAESLRSLGGVAERHHDLATAEEHYRRALAMSEKRTPGTLHVASSLTDLGNLAEKRGDLAAAEEYHRRALEIRQRVAPGTTTEAESLHALGLIQRRSGRIETASDLLLRALDAFEHQTTRLGGTEEVRSGFAAQYEGYYHDSIETLVELNRPAEALHVLERSRARSLLALLAERDVLFTADLAPDLAREKRLRDAEYDRVQARIAQLSPAKDGAEVQELLDRLREVREKQEEIADRIRKASPRFASLQYPEPLDLAGVRNALDPGTTLLAYSVGADKTVLFVVQPTDVPGTGVAVLSLPVGETVLREKTEAFRNGIQRPLGVGRPALLARARGLYDILVRPAESQIAASRRLLISPDGPLHSLPFAALVRQEPGSARTAAAYLVEWKPVHVVASATVYAELRKSRRAEPLQPGRLVAFGDPRYPVLSKDQAGAIEDPDVRSVTQSFRLRPLPYTRNEVEDITSLFADRAQKYLGEEATEERAKSVGKDARYVHFACHGTLDERFPLNSALALTIPGRLAEGQDNGLLQAWEIFDQVRLDADLVTLSACNTGLGKEMGGEGLLGLTRAFHYAGARSVLATLWAVSDKSTPLLMKRFYGYLRAGKSRDEALQAAQIDLIRMRPAAKGPLDLSHPVRWAAFQLSGDWR